MKKKMGRIKWKADTEEIRETEENSSSNEKERKKCTETQAFGRI